MPPQMLPIQVTSYSLIPSAIYRFVQARSDTVRLLGAGDSQPEKRKVGGSTPPLTTSQPAACEPVNRLNVSHRWTRSASLVTVTARSRPSFTTR